MWFFWELFEFLVFKQNLDASLRLRQRSQFHRNDTMTNLVNLHRKTKFWIICFTTISQISNLKTTHRCGCTFERNSCYLPHSLKSKRNFNFFEATDKIYPWFLSDFFFKIVYSGGNVDFIFLFWFAFGTFNFWVTKPHNCRRWAEGY